MALAQTTAYGDLELDDQLTLADLESVARGGRQVTLSAAARQRVASNREFVERLVEDGSTVYGVSTGFGRFATSRIPPAEVRQLQRNLMLSHAVGVGEPFPTEVVRAMLLLRAQSLALGASGVRPLVVERLLDLLNRRIHPVVPSQGSVGASGDLAPLAHIGVVLLGVGEVEVGGELLSSAAALAAAGLEPLELLAKEGLALINGTQAMTAILALTLLDAERLARHADLAAAMTVEAAMGSHMPFNPAVVRLRPHPGAVGVSANMRRLLAGSEIVTAHAECDRVQDAYSLRAVPQVHGASRDALSHVRSVLQVELTAVTDNPLVLGDGYSEEEAAWGGSDVDGQGGLVISAANFHGQPLALAADYAAIAVAELANISERRVEQLVNPALSGLPGFLTEHGGLNSGYMVAQYTAAALVSENKVLAHPASVDSIPTSANQEDHVSMGTHACRKLAQVVANASYVISVELLTAAQALDFRAPLRPGVGVAAAHARLRALVPHLDGDRYLKPELEAVRGAVRDGSLLAAVAAAGVELA